MNQTQSGTISTVKAKAFYFNVNVLKLLFSVFIISAEKSLSLSCQVLTNLDSELYGTDCRGGNIMYGTGKPQ